MKELNYEKVFNTLVKETGNYITNNHLKCMVLGISGGIDSTVVAAVCHEVSKQTGVPLIGRSLPIKNKEDEFDVSELVGNAFCDDFKVVDLHDSYHAFLYNLLDETPYKGALSTKMLEGANGQTPIANGNIQARLRMIYLYNLASIHKGVVMSTDNQTEYQLGFWTIHGDVGDFDPIQDLWKTEVYELATYIADKYDFLGDVQSNLNLASQWYTKANCIRQSIALTPTDGLGISNSDLDQIGAKSYADVDDILQTAQTNLFSSSLNWMPQLYNRYGKEVVDKIWARHKVSTFKREKAPIYIPRERYA